ncbi:3-hydroxyacyl-CoA dehydrogenase family protein [Bradyrhizobium sp. RDM4]|uniref:3-hydroxyacyl-CoA dehydrogenase family protein n=1 Tax=Bradyrhizobium sp. RDM4 TaxID=3378765 RepID=UPI0038FC11FD
MPIIVQNCEGFLGNRMFLKYLAQAVKLAGRGIAPERIDRSLETWGMKMGPFRTMDLIGLDILASGNKPAGLNLLEEFVSRGWKGRKSGVGWYRRDGTTGEMVANAAVSELLPPVRDNHLSDDEIVDRCLLALINEGAAALGERVVQRSSDIDLCYVLGYGFPASKGGPMYQATKRGVAATEFIIDQMGAELDIEAPAKLLSHLAKNNMSFDTVTA